MVAEKLSMKKVREVLRLYHEGLAYRAISRSTHIGLGSVSHYIQRAKHAGLGWPLPEEMNDEQLRGLLFPKEIRINESEGETLLDFKKSMMNSSAKG